MTGTSRPIAALRTNDREELRVTVDDFKGHRLLYFRVWFEAEDGTMRPGNQGVAVRLDLATAPAHAIEAANRG